MEVYENILWVIKKTREFQKNIYFCFINYAKAFDYVDHNKLWKILKEIVIPDHLTCLLRNLYAGQEATVRTGHGTTAAAAAAAAAAKSLQPCLTLCNPIDSSPPGSSVHGIFQARVGSTPTHWSGLPLPSLVEQQTGSK